ncbi:MAG: hypothetical protein K2Y56_17800 [Methylobacterium sp.]|uniref:hypothetical protein n=1 Tax=Methylobacterium sp. TaxID=409 RepID=UPI0025CC22F5|nr:hypothetical protein [Methylobacterium sp.]MBX9933361.1 hypothetical protein [Methylobacterium sp.]
MTDAEIVALSPLRLLHIEKPLVLAHGTAELPQLFENSRVFHAYRSALPGAGALIPVPRADHFTVLEHLRAKDGGLMRVVAGIAEGLRH